MKYLAYFFLTLFYPVLGYSMPPYLGIRVGEQLAFEAPRCVAIAKQTLKNKGFSQITQYRTTATVFAAYRQQPPYHYKAVVKCLENAQVIVVVVVAPVAKAAKQQAERILQQIIQQPAITPVHQLLESQEYPTEIDYSEAWQHSLLERKNCLNRAESALRDAGFYKNIDFDDDSVYGLNRDNHKGLIRCITSESLVSFQVIGQDSKQREHALEKLQQHF